MAIKNTTLTQPLIFHSDQGIQYASQRFTNLLKSYNGLVKQSMSRKGNCWDNAVAESFFKSLKVEWVYWHKYKLRSQAELSIFQWIETWYNTKRRHSYLGNKTIKEFELDMYNQKLVAKSLNLKSSFLLQIQIQVFYDIVRDTKEIIDHSLQNQLENFYNNSEMQKMSLWEISEKMNLIY